MLLVVLADMDDIEKICKLFGNQSDKVRRLFGTSQQQNGLKIQYPKPKTRVEPKYESPKRPTRPCIVYPVARVKAQKHVKARPVRKSLSVIQREIETPQAFTIVKPDMSKEKQRLQEIFQFSYNTSLPSSCVLPRI